MKAFHSRLFCLIVLGVFSISAVPPRETFDDISLPKGWGFLGKKSVDWNVEHAEISNVGHGPFAAVKITLKNGPLKLKKCIVQLTDGSEQVTDLGSVLPWNGESRIIYLESGPKEILKISLWYENKNPAQTKTVFEIWGKY